MTVMLPKSWKKSLNNGVITPVKMRRFDEFRGAIFCVIFQVNETKEVEAELVLLQGQGPNQFGPSLL